MHSNEQNEVERVRSTHEHASQMKRVLIKSQNKLILSRAYSASNESMHLSFHPFTCK